MIYLDNTATTFPKPQIVVDEISDCLKKYCGNPGRSDHSLSIKSAEKIYETRHMLAEIFNGDAENVVFTYNTTYALNMAIKGYLRLSSHVLISDIEHNAVLRPIDKLSREKLCTYDIFSTNGDAERILSDIKNKATDKTSMLICTHVSNISSRRLPIQKIGEYCHKNDIFFIVDGAQSAGIYDIDVKKMHIDALCIPGHKGLYGPQGVGAIVFGTNKIGRSFVEGGTGINSLDLNMPDFLPEFFEAGTPSTPCIAGLNASLKWLKYIGIEKIRKYEESLYDYALERLLSIEGICVYKGSDLSGNTLIFNLEGVSPIVVAEELNKMDICVRSGYHCAPLAHKALNVPTGGAVRLGISVFNSKNDINSLYDALLEIEKRSR